MSAVEAYPEYPEEHESADVLPFNQDIGIARAVRVQLENREEARKYFPEGVEPPIQTAYNHYVNRMFLWDIELTAEVMAKLGSKEIVDWAAYSLIKVTDRQRADGFISNMQYPDQSNGFGVWKIEQSTFKDKAGSDYTHPALLPMSTNTVFEAYLENGDKEGAWKFMKTMHPRTKLHIDYFMNDRATGDDNPLAFNTHPHEDGRDSSGSGKVKLPRLKEDNPLGRIVDYADVAQDIVVGTFIGKNVRLRLANWDLDKAKQIYGRRDVMFNTILSNNARILSGLSRRMAQNEPELADVHEADALKYEEYADQLEQAIYDHTWHPYDVWSPNTRTHKGSFRSLKGNDEPEKNIDVGDLMPVALPHLSAEQLESNLNLILTSFNTNFALPSAPKDSRHYDPHNERKTGCNWSGSTWPHINKMIADGLRMQAERIETEPELRSQFQDEMVAEQTMYLCNLVADRLAEISKKLTKDVYAEQYDSETGEPQRYPHVKNFGMAMQADILPHFDLDTDDSYFKLCRKLGRVVNIISI